MQNNRDTQFDTKLIIYRSRQIALSIVIVIAVAFASVYIREAILAKQSWFEIGLPVCIAFLAFIAFPSTEQWEYKAWQSKAAQIEQQSNGK